MDCKHFKTHGESLVFCSNAENKDEFEGNCRKECCPYGKYVYSKLKELTELKEKFKKTKHNIQMQLDTMYIDTREL